MKSVAFLALLALVSAGPISYPSSQYDSTPYGYGSYGYGGYKAGTPYISQLLQQVQAYAEAALQASQQVQGYEGAQGTAFISEPLQQGLQYVQYAYQSVLKGSYSIPYIVEQIQYARQAFYTACQAAQAEGLQSVAVEAQQAYQVVGRIYQAIYQLGAYYGYGSSYGYPYGASYSSGYCKLSSTLRPLNKPSIQHQTPNT
ncbi:hypothetical protein GWI33_010674 [Rhynchophorus ferrugineus]|uniref:Uncharacterized protein n=1 Tax=Rhynchophorus ferrugineus TaxID=354439 RepID=A0A834ISE0_RHYFE|nr:hypothetical protein GWI33_010674 [Rhynchophorus ferrugineus]